MEGILDGCDDGVDVGTADGMIDGNLVGTFVGEPDGQLLGTPDGIVKVLYLVWKRAHMSVHLKVQMSELVMISVYMYYETIREIKGNYEYR